MHTIDLLFTKHEGSGECNSYELYKIIKSLTPEVIFEELSVSNFHRSYQEEKLRTLETDAIKLYLENHTVKHIPVDTFERPKSYDEQVDYMYARIFGNVFHGETRELRALVDQQVASAARYGFRFLNSRYNDEMFSKFIVLKERVLNLLGNDSLHRTNELEKEVIEKREEAMLTYIYRYCEEHQFSRGLFFIGSGHRASMLQKIRMHNEISATKLNWILHDPETVSISV